jgi:hypothetical protein
MLAQLRGTGEGDWLVAARVHMQGRRSQATIGESPMRVGDGGVGVVVILTDRGGGGQSWEVGG